MPIRFNPSGTLDLGTDPADLPMQMQGKVAVSGAMTRCTNLNIERTGIASTRKGSLKLNTVYEWSYSYDWELPYLSGDTATNPFTQGGGYSYIYTWEADTSTETTDTTIYNLTSGAVVGSINRILGHSGDRYAFTDGGEILRNEQAIATGMTAAPWEAIRYNAYNSSQQSLFALNGYERKRITGSDVQEWGPASPTVAPKIKAGLGTGLTGDYNAKYTWARKEDAVVVWESNPSPAAAAAVALTAENLEVYFTLPTDEQITHVRIYRTIDGGSTYYWDQDVALGWTEYDYSYLFDWETDYIVGSLYQAFTESTSYTTITHSWEATPSVASDDNTIKSTMEDEETLFAYSSQADSALGTELNWTNHDRPPLGGVVLGPNFNGTCFILKDNNLYYCLPNQPEYWPSDYYIEVSSLQFPLIAGAFLDGILYVASAVEVYQISGSVPGQFFPLPMGCQTGTVNYRCFEGVKGQGIYHMGAEGVYLYSGGKDQLVSRGNLDTIFYGETTGNISGLNRTYLTNCWMKSFHGRLYIGYPGGSSQYPDNIFVLDLQSQKMVHHSYAATFRAVGRDFTYNRLLAGDTDGNSWEWEDSDSTTDDGTAISWTIQSADFNQLRKYFPRYAKYDVKVGTGGTASGYILLDDTVAQTHTLNGDRLTRKRLVTGCTGDRLSVRISGTGTVDIYGAEIE